MIPTLNARAFVAQAIHSLKRSSLDLHVIVRDGGSSDGTLQEAETAIADDPRFTVEHAPGESQAEAINAGWACLLHGHEFLTWLNADDMVHARGLREAVKLAVRMPAVAVVYGDFLVIEETGQVIEFVRRPRRISRLQLIYNEPLVPGLVPVIRTEALVRAGAMDATLRFALDHDLFIRLAGEGPLIRTPHIVASFRMHSASKTWGPTAQASRTEAEQVSARYRRLPGVLSRGLRIALRAKIRLQRMAGRVTLVERYGTEEAPTAS